MPGRFLTTVGQTLALALAIAGCAGDEPPQPPADAGVDAAIECAPPEVPCESGCCAAGEPSAPPEDAGPPQSSVDSCCEAQQTAGCEEPTIEACVCAVDRLCCAGAWDDRCVALVEAEGCGQCGAAPSTLCEVSAESDSAPTTLEGALGQVDGVVTDALELSCGSFAEPEVLFAFTAPEAGSYDFSTAGSEIFDTVMAVIDGDACGGDELGCNDDDGSELSSRLVLELTEGQQVLVAVESWGEEPGEIEVEVTSSGDAHVVEPEGCVAGELPASLPASVTGEASDEEDLLTPSCALFGSAGEALHSFTAEQAGRYRFDTRGSDADTIVQVLDGDCTGEELACNDDSDAGGLAAIADLDLVAGQTVLINIDSFDGSGNYTLTVDKVDPTLEEAPTSNTGGCCTEHIEASCADAAVAACVCAVDDYCCTEIWDALCVDAVALLGCGSCG